MVDLTHSSQQEAAGKSPTIDASLGVGMVGGVKALILLLVVVCVGCGEPEAGKATKLKAAAASEAKVAALEAKVAALEAKVAALEAKVAALEAKVAALEAKVAAEVKAEANVVAWVSDPNDPNNVTIEAAIRKSLKYIGESSTGELTQADLEKVTELELDDKQLTSVKGLEKLTQLEGLWLPRNQLTDVKGLKKLTRLTELDLIGNPDLTKAQIDELQKALPKCKINSNPTK